MAPEQILCAEVTRYGLDVYAAGVVLWEALHRGSPLRRRKTKPR
jgi:hypothetical protein